MKSTVWNRVRMMLVTFIALTCVSCSLFPKKDLSGTDPERPKAARNILTSLTPNDTSLEVLYTSVSRGLDESVLVALENFVVEAAAKKTDSAEKVEIIKAGLEILVDLKSAKIEAVVFNDALLALRRTIVLFDVATLKYMQEVGRLPVPASLALSAGATTSNNSLVRALLTFSAVVERSGISIKEGGVDTLPAGLTEKVKEAESRLIKLKPEIFLLLQPYLASAVSVPEAIKTTVTAEERQTNFAIAALNNGLLLVSALQSQSDSGQIDRNAMKISLETWSTDLKTKSAEVASGAAITVVTNIPGAAPKLETANGALPAGTEDWIFTLVENPTLGKVDLSQNPPVYTPNPGENFSIDRYSFRACFKVIPTFCTTTFAVIVQTPVKPWSVLLKTADGQNGTFVRGSDLVCTAALENEEQTAVYRWTLTGLRPGSAAPKTIDVTSWQVLPGRLRTPNTRTLPSGADLDIRDGDRIACEVKARAANGLESSFTSPTLANILASNSPPSEIRLATGVLGFAEQVGAETVPLASAIQLEIFDMDGASSNYNASQSSGHISSITINNCDVVSPAVCPFETEIPQIQSGSTSGVYSVTLKQKANTPLNFEDKPYYDVEFRVVDAGVQQLLKVVRIPVLQRNDPVTGVSPNVISEDENKKLEKNLSAVDPDCVVDAACQSTYSFELLNEQDAAYFEIVGRTLKSLANLEFEPTPARSPSYNLNVRVTDPQGGTATQAISVTVQDKNENPTDITLTLSAPKVNEKTGQGVTIGELSTTDPDAADAAQTVFQYTLTNMNPNDTTSYFEISGRDIKTTANMIDFEKHPQLVFLVTSRDSAGKTYSKTFTVDVENVNEAPTGVSLASDRLLVSKVIQGRDPNNFTGVDPAASLQLFAIDEDVNDTAFTFEITKINGLTYDASNAVLHPFEIVPGQADVLRPKRVLDVATEIMPVFTITVRAQDSGGLKSPEIALTLRLREIVVKPNAISILENSTAQTVGTLCVVEGTTEDCTTDWVYSLVTPPAGDFFMITNNEFKTKGPLDYETFPGLTYESGSGYYYQKLTAVKAGSGLTVNQQIKVTVVNRNEAPTMPTFSPNLTSNTPNDANLYIVEGQAQGGIGLLSTSDPDINGTLNWGVFNDPNSTDDDQFEVVYPYLGDPKKAELRVKVAQLPLGRSEFKFKVFVIDQGFLAAERELTFKVVSKPQISLAGSNVYHKGLHDLGANGLEFDFQINDSTGTARCVLASGSDPTLCTPANASTTPSCGVHVNAISNADVLASAGLSIVEKSSGQGQKTCTLRVMPNENAAGDVSFDLLAKSGTVVGMQVSTSVPVSLSFWRKPELRCPTQVSLPVGASLSDIPCSLHFSDASAPADRSAESISITGSGISWSANKFSGGPSMPASESTATVTVADVTNKFGTAISFSNKTIQLVPKKFSTNGPVFANAKGPNGNIYLGGAFTAVDSIPASGATAVSVSTAARAANCNLTEGFNGPVRTVVFDESDDSFLVGGDFTRYRNQSARRLIRLTCSGEPAAWFSNSGFDGPVHTLVRSSVDGSIFVGGAFSNHIFSKNGTDVSTPTSGLARLKANGVLKKAYTQITRSTSSDGVFALAFAGTSPETLWVGGQFPQYASDISYANLARIDADSGANLLTTSPALQLPVYALAASAGDVFAGGEFGLAKFASSGTNAGFSAAVVPSDVVVRSLLLSSGSLFVGADTLVAKVSATDGSAEVGFANSGVLSLTHSNTNTAPTAYTLASSGSHLVMGGRFTSVGGTSKFNLAKVSASTGVVDANFNSGVGLNDAVRGLAAYPASINDHLFVVGEFSALAGTQVGRLAAFTPEGSFVTALNGSLGSGFNADVNALLFSGNDLFVGGSFTELKGESRVRLVKLLDPASADGTNPIVDVNFDTATNGTLNGDVRALARAPDGSGKVLVGGAFTAYRGASAPGLMRLVGTSGAVDTTLALGTGFAVNPGRPLSINALAILDTGFPNYAIYVGGDFKSYKSTPSRNLVKINHLGTRDTSFVVGELGFNGPVHALLLNSDASRIFVGGQYSSYKAAAIENIAALNATTAALETARWLPGGEVRALALESTTGVWVGGALTSYRAAADAAGTTIGPLVLLSASDLSLTSNPSIGTTLGAHAPNEFSAARGGSQYSSTLFGIHSLLRTSEIVATNPTPRLYVGGLFSLLKEFTAGHQVRLDVDGNLATTP